MISKFLLKYEIWDRRTRKEKISLSPDKLFGMYKGIFYHVCGHVKQQIHVCASKHFEYSYNSELCGYINLINKCWNNPLSSS